MGCTGCNTAVLSAVCCVLCVGLGFEGARAAIQNAAAIRTLLLLHVLGCAAQGERPGQEDEGHARVGEVSGSSSRGHRHAAEQRGSLTTLRISSAWLLLAPVLLSPTPWTTCTRSVARETDITHAPNPGRSPSWACHTPAVRWWTRTLTRSWMRWRRRCTVWRPPSWRYDHRAGQRGSAGSTGRGSAGRHPMRR